jgi:hypothetical protein
MYDSWMFISVYALDRQRELLKWAENERRAMAARRAALRVRGVEREAARATRAARKATARDAAAAEAREAGADLRACQIEPPALRCAHEEHQGNHSQSA